MEKKERLEQLEKAAKENKERVAIMAEHLKNQLEKYPLRLMQILIRLVARIISQIVPNVRS